ncbi:type IV secretory pathway VirB10-like protein [Amycolatopsis bartoniae]|uniref:hypothetical protein n=1 Tax=Amycolatopsis bartoniae TaxID=941986 RepID=UPI001835BCEB|nr:hypothetical protein [Amycolatopsis bartoniae]MBB2936040.1 type IV secretory pathway VirB10-like protein [Amycolatopsis bartoniae]
MLDWVAMDFEVVSDELFAAKREDFTALRDERVKQARPDRALADRIAGLRKPTVAAWLVNQVSRNCPEEVDRLAELGVSLRRAHEQLAGADLRALSRERHEVLGLLNKRAQWLARKAGYAFSDATSRQVDDTFEAAVSDEQALEAVRAARLSAALAPGSPEQWLTAAVVPARAPDRKAQPRKTAPERKPPTRKQPDRKAPDRKTEREAERKRRDRERAAREEVAAAIEARDEAAQALSDAEHRAAEAADTVAELRARLEEATKTERERKAEVTAAKKALTAAKRAADAAEKRLADLD